MPDTGNDRFIMLEECRPLNAPSGTRRTVSLARNDHFTMVTEAQPVKSSTSNPIIDALTHHLGPELTTEGEVLKAPELQANGLLEITLPDSFNVWTDVEHQRFLTALKALLDIPGVKVIARRPG